MNIGVMSSMFLVHTINLQLKSRLWYLTSRRAELKGTTIRICVQRSVQIKARSATERREQRSESEKSKLNK